MDLGYWCKLHVFVPFHALQFQTDSYFWGPLLNRIDGLLRCYVQRHGMQVDLGPSVEMVSFEASFHTDT